MQLPSSSSDDPHGEIQSVDAIVETTDVWHAAVKGKCLGEPERRSDGGDVTTGEAEDGGGGGQTVCCWSSGLPGDKKSLGSKKEESAPNGGPNGGGGGGSNSKGDASASASSRGRNGTLGHQVEKLQRDLNHIKGALTKFRKLEEGFSSQFNNIDEQCRSLDQILSKMAMDQRSTSATDIQQDHNKFHSIKDIVMHLKSQIPSLHKQSTSNTSAHRSDAGFVFNAYYLVNDMPTKDMKEKVLDAPAFKEFRDDLSCIFKDLDPMSKLCLMCFSVFPENAVLRKRLLVNWWIGEGLVDPGEARVDDILPKGEQLK